MCMHYLYSLRNCRGDSSGFLCWPQTFGFRLGSPEACSRVGDWDGLGEETNRSNCFDIYEGREIKA